MAQLQPGQYDLNTGLSGDEIDVCAADANSGSVMISIGKCGPAPLTGQHAVWGGFQQSFSESG